MAVWISFDSQMCGALEAENPLICGCVGTSKLMLDGLMFFLLQPVITRRK